MVPPPEIVLTDSAHVKCDGATDIRGGSGLGHPRVWMQIDETGFVDCGYCDRRFVLRGGPAERGIAAMSAGDLPAPGDASVA
ncbi:zinc-finger domain-containing protein [Croceicoccus sp. F390]|uniref:Zinc-finger domain-containing protein n=1 Tax=Croceicoccus esteveae TaxID=3075597 RepID=A0ABU2ZFL8_9SPHN|nr:zinc-finger domain-containing protein [Croceicoccus sp. F390]MDT0575395.1 zinc-finger domain-containing protein [Croceicoccus sp. F390]